MTSACGTCNATGIKQMIHCKKCNNKFLIVECLGESKENLKMSEAESWKCQTHKDNKIDIKPSVIQWGLSPGALVVIGALLSITLLAYLLLQAGLTPECGNTEMTVRQPSDENLYKNTPNKTDTDHFLVTGQLRMVTRQEWLAQPPAGPVNTIETPIPMAIVIHTVTENCKDLWSCSFQARLIQTHHVAKNGWSDIGYNFLVGGDGAVYEGRGWDRVGAHTRGYNSKGIGLAFMGTFNDVLPSKPQLEAAKQVLELGVALGKLAKDYKLFGHRQLTPTLSPGDALFKEISTWPHFLKGL